MNNKILINIIFFYVLMSVVLISTNQIYAQTDTEHDSLYFFRSLQVKSDSIGKYDLNVFVIGEVELDSLIYVSFLAKQNKNIPLRQKPYAKKYYDRYITKKDNIRYIIDNKNNLSQLIYNKDFFDTYYDYYFMRYFIYPQCNEYEKRQLERVFEKRNSSWINNFNIDWNKSSYIIDKKNEIKYNEIEGENKYLLVLVNRTWLQAKFLIQSSPPRIFDNSNTYIKFLIPLIPD